MNPHLDPKWAATAVLALVTAAGFAEPAAMHDAATHEQLAHGLRQSEQADPMKSLPVSKVVDPMVANPPRSLLADSDVVSFGELATFVPKRAILQVPKNFKDRLKLIEGVQLVSWSVFYGANCGWITTIEISREQAEGKLPLPSETRKMMSKCSNLIVATYQGGPISLLPPKEPTQPAPPPNP